MIITILNKTLISNIRIMPSIRASIAGKKNTIFLLIILQVSAKIKQSKSEIAVDGMKTSNVTNKPLKVVIHTKTTV